MRGWVDRPFAVVRPGWQVRGYREAEALTVHLRPDPSDLWGDLAAGGNEAEGGEVVQSGVADPPWSSGASINCSHDGLITTTGMSPRPGFPEGPPRYPATMELVGLRKVMPSAGVIHEGRHAE